MSEANEMKRVEMDKINKATFQSLSVLMSYEFNKKMGFLLRSI